jgi:mannitol/fructose-specific phosphotransferase system IIA component (Ntr-type)
VQLSELIQEDVIKIGLEAASKWEAIEEMVDVLIDAHELRLTDRAEVIDAVVTRERSLSTGLEHGLAVPHGAVECVGDIIASLGTSGKGIPFASQDGRPAHLVVLLVIPKGSFQNHVRTLAGIARLAMNQELRERIAAAREPKEVMDAISSLEAMTGPVT